MSTKLFSVRIGLWASLSVVGVVAGAASCAKVDDDSSGGGGESTSTTDETVTTVATTSASSTTGMGGAGGGETGCSDSSDCIGNPDGEVCDTSNGECVICTEAEDTCPDGQYCVNEDCEIGCTDEADCPGDTVCDENLHACVNCSMDPDCPAGSICVANTCIPGCSPTQSCQAGFTCCGSTCYDVSSDPDHCGTCPNDCEAPENAGELCLNGVCAMGPCNNGWADCNGDAMDGCEHSTIEDGPCLCNPGDTQSCYYGAPGTQGQGVCQAGTQECNPSGTSWGACNGQIMPSYEICANGVDEDCDGTADNAVDIDGDGWSYCNGDCNDGASLINPGAYEVLNNGVNDDCDAASSDTVAPVCASAQKLTGVTPSDVASAMELCQTTTANPPMPNKKWGVVSASYRLGSGAVPTATQLTNMQNYAGAVLTNYGTNNVPKKNNTFGAISTGRMRYTGQPDFVSPNGGYSFGTPSSCPATYLAAHGGALPSSAGCNGACTSANTCNDSLSLRLDVRVPTNAQSLSYDFRFFSGEFPEWTCTQYNDFYLALVTSSHPGIPMDHNISFDSLGNPVSVNNGFFDACQATGCYTCPLGVTPLAGTGMDGNVGGGTNWLTTDAPIIPGETITLELMVFDVGDTAYDSLTLLDNFRWNLVPLPVGTHE
jgi:hypothetical protein